MIENIWRERITYRSDMVARVTHLTRGATDEEAFITLWKILNERKLVGSGKAGYIVGETNAVCFQELPLRSIAENLLFEDKLGDKNRYSSFGLRVNKGTLYQRGGRPVIYGKTDELKQQLTPSEYWRIVRMEFDNKDSIVDWSHEREWRCPGDFEFQYSEIEIILKDEVFYKKFVSKCIAEGKQDILCEINGIVCLKSELS